MCNRRISLIFIIVILFSSNLSAKQYLNLDRLISEAIKNHPKIKDFTLKHKASQKVPSRAGSLPDPVLKFSAQNFKTDDFNYNSSAMSSLGFGLAQSFPFPGKLKRRKDIAIKNAMTAFEKKELTQALVVYNVKKAYWNLYYYQRSQQIIEEELQVVDRLIDVIIERVKVGKVPQQDALQAQVAYTNLKAMLIQLKEQVYAAKRELNRSVGRDPKQPVSFAKLPPLRAINLDLKKLLRIMTKSSPYLKVSKVEVLKNKSVLNEARYDRLPDFKLGVDYKLRDIIAGDRTNGADMVSVGFAITIPIWMSDKQNARVIESNNRLYASVAKNRDIELTISSRLQILVENINRLNKEIKLYKQVLIKQADQALGASIRDYKSARVGFVSVVQNWDILYAIKLKYEKLIEERFVTMSEITLVSGKD